MALKFLNKKGWHTGSLRNIENVWKAEQKHEAEQKKLEELRKQIQDEREKSEFRLLQEQAGLVPKQERLEFLYDSGLAVGKGSGGGGGGGGSGGGGQGVAFKALEEAGPGNAAKAAADVPSSSSLASASVPGALFEDKPHSANDAWRKLHSDPLLLIRQREQEALARVKNNPVQMALIRKSAEAKKEKEKAHDKKESKKKHKHNKAKHHKHSSSRQELDSENVVAEGDKKRKTANHNAKHHHKARSDSDDELSEREHQRRSTGRDSKYRERSPSGFTDPRSAKYDSQDVVKKNHDKSRNEKRYLEGWRDLDTVKRGRETRSFDERRSYYPSSEAVHHDSQPKRRNLAPKLSEEERAARLREMQADAELHEEQRWKRLRKAEEEDAQEAKHASNLGGKNFLDAANRSVYGAEKGGSSTIEESVRRRTHYSQGRSEAGDGNAFRR